MSANNNSRSGNSIRVSLGGLPVGVIQSVDMRDDYSPEALSGIGDIHAQEHVPSMARHTLNVEEMVLKTASLLKAGVAVENGDDVLKGNVFDFSVVDKDSGTVLRSYTGCSYASGSVTVRKHAIVVSSAMFNALNVTGVL
ncbi:MAG: hypothetical protein HOD58_12155 [Gammaproteobacteria bacterium]|nr:hypothetical protein [Gammaproteobacteria bacterium]